MSLNNWKDSSSRRLGSLLTPRTYAKCISSRHCACQQSLKSAHRSTIFLDQLESGPVKLRPSEDIFQRRLLREERNFGDSSVAWTTYQCTTTLTLLFLRFILRRDRLIEKLLSATLIWRSIPTPSSKSSLSTLSRQVSTCWQSRILSRCLDTVTKETPNKRVYSGRVFSQHKGRSSRCATNFQLWRR